MTDTELNARARAALEKASELLGVEGPPSEAAVAQAVALIALAKEVRLSSAFRRRVAADLERSEDEEGGSPL